jgi:hypothetical protein
VFLEQKFYILKMAAEIFFETTVNFTIAATQVIVICIYKAGRNSSRKGKKKFFYCCTAHVAIIAVLFQLMHLYTHFKTLIHINIQNT